MKLSYEEWLIALCMWREARGEGNEGMLAVHWVVRNRVASTKTTPYSVITKPFQFSSFNANDSNASQFPNPSNPEWVQACGIVTQPGPDPTGGAQFYFRSDLKPWPKWSDGLTKTATIGAHVFFKA